MIGLSAASTFVNAMLLKRASKLTEAKFDSNNWLAANTRSFVMIL